MGHPQTPKDIPDKGAAKSDETFPDDHGIMNANFRKLTRRLLSVTSNELREAERLWRESRRSPKENG
jgi:hypothetical protein